VGLGVTLIVNLLYVALILIFDEIKARSGGR
jgi:hypothetical protein